MLIGFVLSLHKTQPSIKTRAKSEIFLFKFLLRIGNEELF